MLLLASLPNKGVYQEFDGKRYLPDFHLYGLGRMMTTSCVGSTWRAIVGHFGTVYGVNNE